MIDHNELLRHSLATDKRLKDTKQPSKPVAAKPYVPPTKLVEPDDPFGGNENNRKVAEAAAKEQTELKSVEEPSKVPAKPAKTSKASKANPDLVWKPNA